VVLRGVRGHVRAEACPNALRATNEAGRRRSPGPLVAQTPVTDPLSLGAESVGARFNLVSAVPAATLVLFVTALLLSGAPGAAPSLSRTGHALGRLSVQDIGFLIFVTTALALVLNPFQVGFVKLLEGYGPENGALEWLRTQGRRRFEARYEYLEALSSPPEHGAQLTDPERKRIEEQGQRADTQLAELPRYGRLMPTRLGNALRCAEDHAGRGYGLDAIEVIPRLFPLMDPGMVGIINDARNELDVLVSFVLVWLIATVVAVLALCQYGAWILVAAGTYWLAWLAYRAGVVAAREYGETLIWAMDLYRFNLYEQLRIDPPADNAEELAHGDELTTFLKADWARNERIPPHWGPTYRHRAPAPPATGRAFELTAHTPGERPPSSPGGRPERVSGRRSGPGTRTVDVPEWRCPGGLGNARIAVPRPDRRFCRRQFDVAEAFARLRPPRNSRRDREAIPPAARMGQPPGLI
jgi:hypothetical protein